MNGDARLGRAAIHVLLAIGPGERHGYAIMREIESMTEGRVRVAPGTLYTNIRRLLEAGLIVEAAERPDPELDDERRRYYRLSPSGRRVVAAEVERLGSLVARVSSWVRELQA
jgi:DNA-binding PadR family transcriptional regulator